MATKLHTIEQNLERIADALERLASFEVTKIGEMLHASSPAPQAEPAVEVVEETAVVEEPVVEEPVVEEPVVEEAKTPKIGLEEIVARIRSFAKDQGKEAAFEVLGRFKAAKASDLKPAQYAEAIAAFDAYESAADPTA